MKISGIICKKLAAIAALELIESIFIFLSLFLIIGTAAFSQYDDEAVEIGENCFVTSAVVDDQEKIVVTIDEVPYYEVATRTEAECIKLFFILRNFSEKTLRMYGIKWFKANLI